MTTTCTAFEGSRRIASGPLADVVAKVKPVLESGSPDPVLIFDDQSSALVEVDFRGEVSDILRRLEPESGPRGAGRPKLGVIGREVTLLPRHWDWLNSQPGGASVTLRKLVDEARRASHQADTRRTAQESAYRFMVAMAGNAPGFEEATRALFAGNSRRFEEETDAWPDDVREHVRKLARAAF